MAAQLAAAGVSSWGLWLGVMDLLWAALPPRPNFSFLPPQDPSCTQQPRWSPFRFSTPPNLPPFTNGELGTPEPSLATALCREGQTERKGHWPAIGFRVHFPGL